MKFRDFIGQKPQKARVSKRIQQERINRLKSLVVSMFRMGTLDVDTLGKYILDEFYELSLFDGSNVLRPVDINKNKVPGVDTYNFNNALYYKYNYYSYDFRHPMSLDDVLSLIDTAYANYGKRAINKIYTFVSNIREE